MKLRKLTGLFCMLVILTLMTNTFNVSAANKVYSDSYESYTEGKLIDTSVFSYKLLRNVLSVRERDNQYLDIVARVGLTPEEQQLGYVVKPGRIIQELNNAPDGKFLVSVDFRTPRSVGNNVELFGVQYRDGNGHVASVWLRDNMLYTSNGSNSTPQVYISEDIQANKWYNAQILVDTEAKTYQVRCEGDFCEPQEFVNSAEWLKAEVYDRLGLKWSESCADILRVFSVTNNSSDIHIHIDNGVIALLNNPELDIAAFEAYGMLVNKMKGTLNGMYPPSVFTMLQNVYTEAMEKGKQSNMDPEELEILKEKLDRTIEIFKNNCIDTGSSDGVASYIESGIPSEAVVYSDGGFEYALNSETTVYDRGKCETSDEVVWEIIEGIDGVSIENGKLIAAPGCEGEVLLRASAGDIYDEFPIELIAERSVTINEFTAYEGVITIKGSISQTPKFPVSLNITGENISVENAPVSIDSENSFEWMTTVPEIIPPEELKITIQGEDISALEFDGKYYGMNWREVLTEVINNAESIQNTEEILKEFYFGLNTDDNDIFEKYSSGYAARVYEEKGYDSYDGILAVIAESNCVMALKDSTRQNIEEVVTEYAETLSENGFDSSSFKGLSSKKKASFYVEAAAMNIDEAKDSLSEICEKLNDITEDLADSGSSGGGSSGGSSGGRGNGSSKGSLSVGGGFAINPVATQPEPDNTGITAEVEEFSDINQAEWAKEALMYLKAKNIMVGYNNMVRPNDYVTRGEFTKMLVTAFSLKTDQDKPAFTDANGTWWKEYADTASSLGIINGFSDGSFRGDDIINREMLAVMTYRTINATNTELYDKNENGKLFNDSDLISDYAKEAVNGLYVKGIVSGIGDNLFAPQISVTRAEAAQIIYNVIIQK